MQIIFRDIIPMLIPIITINAIFIAVGGVVAQAGLAFFGLGDLRSVNWGTELYYFFNQDGIAYKAWWWLLPPGIGIIILGLGANFLSNGIFETTKPQKGEYRMFEQRNNELIVETWSDKVPVCTCYR